MSRFAYSEPFSGKLLTWLWRKRNQKPHILLHAAWPQWKHHNTIATLNKPNVAWWHQSHANSADRVTDLSELDMSIYNVARKADATNTYNFIAAYTQTLFVIVTPTTSPTQETNSINHKNCETGPWCLEKEDLRERHRVGWTPGDVPSQMLEFPLVDFWFFIVHNPFWLKEFWGSSLNLGTFVFGICFSHFDRWIWTNHFGCSILLFFASQVLILDIQHSILEFWVWKFDCWSTIWDSQSQFTIFDIGLSMLVRGHQNCKCNAKSAEQVETTACCLCTHKNNRKWTKLEWIVAKTLSFVLEKSGLMQEYQKIWKITK